MLRGNVQTRLDKAANGTFDAVVLAMAGLNRLGLAEHATEALDPESFTPAVGQGAIALVAREGDSRVLGLTAAITHRETGLALAAERAFLGVLDGSCRTPIGGSARLMDGGLHFSGIVLSPDGSRAWTRGAMLPSPTEAEAAELGASLGRQLRAEIPAGLVG